MSSRTQAVIARKNSIRELDDEISKLAEDLKRLRARKAVLEKEAIEFLDKEGVERISDEEHNISIKELDVPVIQNFTTFWNYVRKNNAPELMNRSVNSKGWRERDKKVPGVGTFTKRSLSITTRR